MKVALILIKIWARYNKRSFPKTPKYSFTFLVDSSVKNHRHSLPALNHVVCYCSQKSPNSSSQNPLPEGRGAAAPLVLPLCCGWESWANHHLAVRRQRAEKDGVRVHPAHPWLRWRIGDARLSLPQQAHPHQQWRLHSDCPEQTGKGWGHSRWDVYGEPLRSAGSGGDHSRWVPETVLLLQNVWVFFLLRSIP